MVVHFQIEKFENRKIGKKNGQVFTALQNNKNTKVL